MRVNNHLIEIMHKCFHRSTFNLTVTDRYNKPFLVLKGNEGTILPLRMEKYKETGTGKKFLLYAGDNVMGFDESNHDRTVK